MTPVPAQQIILDPHISTAIVCVLIAVFAILGLWIWNKHDAEKEKK